MVPLSAYQAANWRSMRPFDELFVDATISSSDTRHGGLSKVPYLLGISWYLSVSSVRPNAKQIRSLI